MPTKATSVADSARADRVHAELRPDGPLLEHHDLRRQGAGAQEDREPRRFLGVKLPVMIPEPPAMCAWITGAEITWLSSTMAKGLPMFSRGVLAERRAARGLKRKVTAGRPFWSKEGWLSTSCSPVTTAPLLHHVEDAGLVHRGQHLLVEPRLDVRVGGAVGHRVEATAGRSCR